MKLIKKRKYLLSGMLILVLSASLMGVGYASWQQTLTEAFKTTVGNGKIVLDEDKLQVKDNACILFAGPYTSSSGTDISDGGRSKEGELTLKFSDANTIPMRVIKITVTKLRYRAEQWYCYNENHGKKDKRGKDLPVSLVFIRCEDNTTVAGNDCEEVYDTDGNLGTTNYRVITNAHTTLGEKEYTSQEGLINGESVFEVPINYGNNSTGISWASTYGYAKQYKAGSYIPDYGGLEQVNVRYTGLLYVTVEYEQFNGKGWSDKIENIKVPVYWERYGEIYPSGNLLDDEYDSEGLMKGDGVSIDPEESAWKIRKTNGTTE